MSAVPFAASLDRLRRRPAPRADRPGGTLDRLFIYAIVICVAATVIVLLPGVHGHVVLPTADLVLDTIALVACVTLTALAWARFRESRVIAAVYHAAAFLALSVAYAIGVTVSLMHSNSISSLADPENAQVLVFAVAQLVAALLFVIAGTFIERRTYGWGPTWILVAPALAVLLAALVGASVDPPDLLQIIRFEGGSELPHITPFGAALHLVTAALFFVGAYASRRLWHAGRAAGERTLEFRGAPSRAVEMSGASGSNPQGSAFAGCRALREIHLPCGRA